jgi:predicted Zn-dependent protease
MTSRDNWRRGSWRAGLTLFAFIGLGVAACTVSPTSGRPTPVLSSSETERATGEKVAKMVEEQMGLVEDPELVAYVRAIGKRVAAHSPRKDVEYTFFVVDIEEPNAFALPGGFIYVSRGLLPLINSEDELAGVLGHEVGHVAALHYAKRQIRSAPFIPVRIATGLGGAIASIVSPGIGRTIAGVGEVSSALVLSPYSRGQENEADELGQQFAAAAGWDPIGISTFMATLSREQALLGHDPDRTSFLSTHPTSPARAARTAERAATLERASARPIAGNRADLFGRMDGLLVGASAREGVFDENRFHHPVLKFSLAFPKRWETFNTSNAVGAGSPDKKAVVVLTLAAEGDDPAEAARSFRTESGVRARNIETFRIGNLKAARSQIKTGGFFSRRMAELTWIAHAGRIYQIAGVSGAGEFSSYRSTFVAAARSFHPLRQSERDSIREDRLHVTRARSAETVEAVLDRSGSRWNPEAAAVANGVQVDTPFESGRPVKVTRPAPYKG